MPARTPATNDPGSLKVGTLSRRGFLGCAVAATALLAPDASADTTTPNPATTWGTYQCPACGAAVQYPSNWVLDTDFDSDLLFPPQAFAVHSGDRPPADTDSGLPDLSSYPSDGVIAWLFYYEQIFSGDPSRSGLTVSQLTAIGCGFPNFAFSVGAFAGSSRSFLLWVYSGRNASSSTQTALAHVVSSISVP